VKKDGGQEMAEMMKKDDGQEMGLMVG